MLAQFAAVVNVNANLAEKMRQECNSSHKALQNKVATKKILLHNKPNI